MRAVVADHLVEFEPGWHTDYGVLDGPDGLGRMDQAVALGEMIRHGFENGAVVVTADGISGDKDADTWNLAEFVTMSREYGDSSDFRVSTAWPEGQAFRTFPDDTSKIDGVDPRFFMHINKEAVEHPPPDDIKPWEGFHTDGVFAEKLTTFTQISPYAVAAPDLLRQTEVVDASGVFGALSQQFGRRVLRHTGLYLQQLQILYDRGYLHGRENLRLAPVIHPLLPRDPDTEILGFAMSTRSLAGSNIHDLPDGPQIIGDIIEAAYAEILDPNTRRVIHTHDSPDKVIAFRNLLVSHRGKFSDGTPLMVARIHRPGEVDIAPHVIEVNAA